MALSLPRRPLVWPVPRSGDPCAKNEDSDTALHLASLYGTERIVDLLIKAGADVHASNERGESFLDLALPRKRLEIVKALARHGIEERTVSPAAPAARGRRRVEQPGSYRANFERGGR